MTLIATLTWSAELNFYPSVFESNQTTSEKYLPSEDKDIVGNLSHHFTHN